MAAPIGPTSSNPQVSSQNPPQPSQAQTQVDIDPIAKVKQLLLPRLKESLVVNNNYSTLAVVFVFRP